MINFEDIIKDKSERKEIVKLADMIRFAGGRLYVVGGAVRDTILDRKVEDIDLVVVGLDESTMVQAIGHVSKVGESFPVYLWGDYEIAMARSEKSTGPGHKDFEVNFGPEITLEEDAVRRDFTINALYFNILENELVDPLGEGLEHIRDHLLVHIGEHFKDDPLRVFRAGRFLSEMPNFTPGQGLVKICLETDISHLPAERVSEETRKAFHGKFPRAYFEFLLQVGALHEWFPELAQMPKVEDRHNGNVWEHIMAMLEKPTVFSLGWAVLVHDIGKIKTPPSEWPSHHGHENEKELAWRFLDRYRLPASVVRFALKCQKHHMKAHRAKELRPGTLWDMFDDIPGRSEFLLFTLLHKRDCVSAGRDHNTEYLGGLWLKYKEVTHEITGDNVLEKHPDLKGPRVGEILRDWRINEFASRIKKE